MRKGNILPIVLGAIAVLIIGGLIWIYFGRQLQNKTLDTKMADESSYSLEEHGDSKVFYNHKFRYKLTLPKSWNVKDETGKGELFLVSGDGLMIEFQQETEYNIQSGESLESILDSVPSPARSQPTTKEKLGENVAYVQRGIADGGELDRATYIKVKNGNKYLPIVVISGTYDNSIPILKTLTFLDR